MLLVREATAEQTSPALVLAYAASYLVGRRRLLRRSSPAGSAASGSAGLVRFAGPAAGGRGGLDRRRRTASPGCWPAWATTRRWASPCCAGSRSRRVDVVLFLLLARLFRLTEVTDVLDTVTRRLRSRVPGLTPTYDDQQPS